VFGRRHDQVVVLGPVLLGVAGRERPELHRFRAGAVLGEAESHASHRMIPHPVCPLEFPDIGRKRMILNARKIIQKEMVVKPMILLAVQEATGKE
jgi:hypothetical protein